MKYILVVLLILFASFADIFLFRIDIIPVQPSSFLLPLFLILTAIKYPVQDILITCKSHTFKFFVVILFFSVMYSPISRASPDLIFEEIVLNILTLLLYVYILHFFKSESKWLVFLVVFIAFTVLAGSVWYDYFVGLPKFSQSLEDMVRKGGFGENPNQAASAMKFLALCVLVFLQDKKAKRILFIIAMVVSVFLTFSRSGIISLILILILGTSNNWNTKFNINPQKLFKSVFSMAILFLSLYIGLIFLTGILKNEFPELARGAMGDRVNLLLGKSDNNVIAEDMGSGGGRGDLLFKYIDHFIEKPFGQGTAFTADKRFNPLNTHNYYLYLAVNLGLLVLLAYFLFILKSLQLSLANDQFYYLIFIILLIFEGLVTHHIYFNRSMLISLAFFDSLIYRARHK